jgi:hypothetical protein
MVQLLPQILHMKKTLITLTLLILLANAQGIAQSGMPVWQLPVANGTTFRVDMDAQTHLPLRRQIMLSEVPGGGGLQIAAAASGLVHLLPELNILGGCNDSFPHPDEDCPGPKSMIVEHGNNFYTLYSHMDTSSYAAYGIYDGATVAAGQVLGQARQGGATGLRKVRFEVLQPNDPNWLNNPLNILVRSIVTVRTRNGSYQYDSQNRSPVFQIGTQQRQLVAGEILSTSATKTQPSLGSTNGVALQLFPNPVTQDATLQMQLSLPASAAVSVTVCNLQGTVVAMPLTSCSLDAGASTVPLDLSRLSSGLYILHVNAGSFTQSAKIAVR